MVFVGLTYLIAGIGILKRKNWARLFFLFIMLFVLIGSLRASFAFIYRISKPQGVYTPLIDAGVALITLFYIVLPLASFYYFIRPKVKEQFK